MSALAIQPATSPEPAAPVREKDKDKGDDFKGTLKTAQKKPPAEKAQQAKKPVADDQQPDDARSPVVQQLVAVAQVAKPIAQDLSSMISAGKSLVGTAVAVVDANQAVDQPAALEPVKALADGRDALPMTPLEQAVHDVLERLHDDSSKGESTHDDDDAQPAFQLPGVTSIAFHVDDKKPEHVAPVEAVRELPEQQQVNQSHVHLVIDDGERLVMTVAVRGDQVITHIRGDNAETTAALARNAGVLDDHLRARGLSLGELQATHDQSQPEKRQEKPHYDQPEREQQQPRFSMEENL